jgi:transposase
MPSLVAKTVKGHKYWQLVESRRVDGKPRSFVLMHIGRPADLLRRLQQIDANRRIHSTSFGAVATLWELAQQFGLAELLDAEIARDQRGQLPRLDGLSPGTSLVLATIGRACRPMSKRAWADWARTTSLPRIASIDAARLTSQHFWSQMNRFPVEAIARVEQNLVRLVVEKERVAPDVLFYDTTNFFTFIASDNERNTITKRGHNKQKRHDLRQLGLGLVVSRDGQLPLFHLVYEGSRPDVRVFPEVLTSLRERVHALWSGAETTIVYDKGNNSRSNQANVDASPLHYVGSLVPTSYPELIDEALQKMKVVTLADGQQVRAYRVERELWGQRRTLVVVHSEVLRDAQVRGLKQQLDKRHAALGRLAANLEKPRGGRGRRDKLDERIAEILRGQHMKDLIHVEVFKRQGRLRIRVRVDEERQRHLTDVVFGKRILMTDHHEWSDADVIAAYRGQATAERAFRDLKDPGQLAVRPTFHWTDQKLRVHAFICILGYLMLQVLLRRARAAGIDVRSPRSLMARLSAVREATIIEGTAEAGRPKIFRQLEEMDADTAALFNAFRGKLDDN